MLRAIIAVSAAMVFVAGCGAGQNTNSPATSSGTARISFEAPVDGVGLNSPVTVRLEAENIRIEPAGRVSAGGGHFIIRINIGCVPTGEQLVTPEEGLIDLEEGQAEAQLELTPGEYRLCAQVVDGSHTALGPTDQIEVSVLTPRPYTRA
jgi:hypothetical protein